MNIQLTDISACEKSLAVEIPAEVAKAEFDRVSQKYAKLVRVPGFRAGKAPASIVKRRFYQEIRSQVIQDLINKHYKEALSSRNLTPVSEPTFKRVEFDLGQPLRFEVTFEVLPEISLGQYKGLKVEVKEEPVTEIEVDEVIERMRDEMASFVPVEGRAIKEGDFVILDLEAKFASPQERNFTEKGLQLQVGTPSLPPAFSENLIGMTRGQEKDFAVSFDQTYEDKRFAAKTVNFRVKVREIKEKILPELNDEFAKDVGDYKSLSELRQKVRSDLQERSRKRAEDEAKVAILDLLAESNPFEVPESLIKRELEEILKDIAYNLARDGIDVEKSEIDWRKIAQDNRPQAVRRVQRGLILDRIAQLEGLSVTDEELELELKRIAHALQMSVEAVRARYQKENKLEGLRESLLRKKALDLVYAHATIIRR